MKSQFIFKSYDFSETTKTLSLNYVANGTTFTEKYKFDFEFTPNANKKALDKAIQTLFFMAGVSYYKAFIPKEIIIKAGQLDTKEAHFFTKTYQKGLGEFFYVNKLDPKTPVNFVANSSKQEIIEPLDNDGLLIGVGGGKDSLVSIELLKNLSKVATWSVGHKSQLSPLIDRIGLNHFWVERSIDSQLISLNKSGALNGHVPISAILSCVGIIVAILTGYRDVVVSNESSANEPTLTYQNTEINHQYSKSLEYEQDFQDYLKHSFNEGVRYYSFLRPLSELKIAELFSNLAFTKYKDVFSSCNRAFTQNQDKLFWCGECAKCAFIFLALTPFLPSGELEALFSGSNLVKQDKLVPIYKSLLGIDGPKPLECVGEVKESRWAMDLAKEHYPELVSKYQYDVPVGFDYRALAKHLMPPEIYQVLTTALAQR